ncbi:hypothetical protein FQN60_006438, partial [Etheostoma spectabile]
SSCLGNLNKHSDSDLKSQTEEIRRQPSSLSWTNFGVSHPNVLEEKQKKKRRGGEDDDDGGKRLVRLNFWFFSDTLWKRVWGEFRLPHRPQTRSAPDPGHVHTAVKPPIYNPNAGELLVQTH